MHPPAGRADRAGDHLDERRHVVLGDALDLGDAPASNAAFARISRASSCGTTPSRAHASATEISISSQCRSLASSDQTAAISGRT